MRERLISTFRPKSTWLRQAIRLLSSGRSTKAATKIRTKLLSKNLWAECWISEAVNLAKQVYTWPHPAFLLQLSKIAELAKNREQMASSRTVCFHWRPRQLMRQPYKCFMRRVNRTCLGGSPATLSSSLATRSNLDLAVCATTLAHIRGSTRSLATREITLFGQMSPSTQIQSLSRLSPNCVIRALTQISWKKV